VSSASSIDQLSFQALAASIEPASASVGIN